MIKDFLWKTFEVTGDTGYYLEYRKWQIYYKQCKSEHDERTNKTG